MKVDNYWHLKCEPFINLSRELAAKRKCVTHMYILAISVKCRVIVFHDGQKGLGTSNGRGRGGRLGWGATMLACFPAMLIRPQWKDFAARWENNRCAVRNAQWVYWMELGTVSWQMGHLQERRAKLTEIEPHGAIASRFFNETTGFVLLHPLLAYPD
jgi:hypothetical protein